METKAQRIIRLCEKAKGLRLNWEGYWDEVAALVLPSFSNTFDTGGYHSTRGQKHDANRFDNRATIALQRFSASMESMLTPRNARWHSLRASDTDLMKSPSVRDWFDRATDEVFKQRGNAKANFSSQAYAHYQSLGAFGTACMFVDKLQPVGLRYSAIHISQVYFYENHQGIIDQAFRRFRMTARQLMQNPLFEGQVSENVRKAAKKDPDEMFYIIHWVGPNTEKELARADFRGMEVSSVYVEEDEEKILLEEGYNSFPYAISRYATAPGEVYGRSPAMDALTNIKVLNEQKKTLLKQGHRTVDPVLLAHDDGVLDSFSLRPGAVNIGAMSRDGKRLVDVLPTGNIAVGHDMMDREREAIDSAFLLDLFKILHERPQMTATEVIELSREKGMLLSPTMGRQQSEFLDPLIGRELDLLMQQQLLDDLPGELIEAAGDYTIEYDSPLSRAQKAEQSAGLMRAVEFAVNIATQAQDPTPLDHFNWDTIIPEFSMIQAVPQRWMKTMDQVDEVRQGRQRQMETEQAIQAAPAIASMVPSQ